MRTGNSKQQSEVREAAASSFRALQDWWSSVDFIQSNMESQKLSEVLKTGEAL